MPQLQKATTCCVLKSSFNTLISILYSSVIKQSSHLKEITYYQRANLSYVFVSSNSCSQYEIISSSISYVERGFESFFMGTHCVKCYNNTIFHLFALYWFSKELSYASFHLVL